MTRPELVRSVNALGLHRTAQACSSAPTAAAARRAVLRALSDGHEPDVAQALRAIARRLRGASW